MDNDISIPLPSALLKVTGARADVGLRVYAPNSRRGGTPRTAGFSPIIFSSLVASLTPPACSRRAPPSPCPSAPPQALSATPPGGPARPTPAPPRPHRLSPYTAPQAHPDPSPPFGGSLNSPRPSPAPSSSTLCGSPGCGCVWYRLHGDAASEVPRSETRANPSGAGLW